MSEIHTSPLVLDHSGLVERLPSFFGKVNQLFKSLITSSIENQLNQSTNRGAPRNTSFGIHVHRRPTSKCWYKLRGVHLGFVQELPDQLLMNNYRSSIMRAIFEVFHPGRKASWPIIQVHVDLSIHMCVSHDKLIQNGWFWPPEGFGGACIDGEPPCWFWLSTAVSCCSWSFLPTAHICSVLSAPQTHHSLSL